MMRSIVVPVLYLLCVPALAEDQVLVLGKQRAAQAPREWDVRDAQHPSLGTIRFAVLKTPIVTTAGNVKVYSRLYLSCERGVRTIAVELAHGMTPEDPAGLKPKSMPELVCNSVDPTSGEKLRPQAFEARWIPNELGDVMARGLRPFPVRDCVSIGVKQEVLLRGDALGSARVQFDFSPYDRELDSVFTACGQVSAYGASPLVTASSPQPAATPPAPTPVKLTRANDLSWQSARTTSSGRTNVRAQPNVNAPLVKQLDPGAVVLIQPAEGGWWRIKPLAGSGFEGYVRQDRLSFR